MLETNWRKIKQNKLLNLIFFDWLGDRDNDNDLSTPPPSRIRPWWPHYSSLFSFRDRQTAELNASKIKWYDIYGTTLCPSRDTMMTNRTPTICPATDTARQINRVSMFGERTRDHGSPSCGIGLDRRRLCPRTITFSGISRKVGMNAERGHSSVGPRSILIKIWLAKQTRRNRFLWNGSLQIFVSSVAVVVVYANWQMNTAARIFWVVRFGHGLRQSIIQPNVFRYKWAIQEVKTMSFQVVLQYRFDQT